MTLRVLVFFAVAQLMAALSPVHAGIINTLPPDSHGGMSSSNGPDAQGGTFTADASFLKSVTVSAEGSAGFFRVALHSTTVAGVPDALIWENGADIAFPEAATTFTFSPNLALTPGEQYYLGLDTGLFTASAGGNGGVGFVGDGDTILGNFFYNNFNGGGFNLGSGDISAEIVMVNATPEPSAAILAALGLPLLLVRRRRQR